MRFELATERLKLRPCTRDDVDVLLPLWREPLVRRYLLDDRVVDRAEVEQFVDEFMQLQAERRGCLWLAEADGGAALGFTALKQIAGTSEVEIYYGLAPNAWGQGLATEASQAVLDFGFGSLALPRIWARTDPPNEASKRVAARLGMRAADDPGETSLVSFVLEREDWNAAHTGRDRTSTDA